MSLTCPNCRLLNPDSAMSCDCGYKFQGNAHKRKFHVDPLRIKDIVDARHYDHMIAQSRGPRILNFSATLISLLVIPCLLATILVSFFWKWWFLFPGAVSAWLCARVSYMCQREAIRQLALTNENAYTFLRLEGFIVPDEGSEAGRS